MIQIKSKLLAVIALATALTVTAPINAYAEVSSVKEAIELYGDDPTIKSYISTKKEGTYTVDVPVNGTTYYYNNNKKQNIIDAANELQEKEAKLEETKTKDEAAVKDFNDNVTDGMKIAANTRVATQMLSGFEGVISTLLGLMVIGISVGMTIFSGFDLCYIAFPVFRNKCEDAKASGTGMMASRSKTSTGETKLRFVSDDAQYAVTAADTVQSGQNPFMIYFKKRLLSYIVLAILLFILLTGKITVFTDIALKLTSGILDLIQGV